MKKLILVFALVLTSFGANAQFSVGASFGLPTGDVSDGYTFALGIDANYMFESESDFSYGVATGYLTYFGDEILGISIDNASFLPLAGALRYTASEKFTLGADLGYAIGLAPDGNDGGFYYRPMVSYALGENTSLNLSYSGVSVDGGTFSNVGLGVMFGL
ncbi:MAG: transporter [Flavobacteriaceae bacterium]